MAIEKLRSHRSPGIDQIPAEFIKVRGSTIRYEFHKLLFLFGIRRNCLRSGMSRSFHLSIKWVIKQTVVIIEVYHFCQIRTKFIQHPAAQVNSICRENYCGSSVWISTQQVKY